MKSSMKRTQRIFLGRASGREIAAFYKNCRVDRRLRRRWLVLRELEARLCGRESHEGLTHFDVERMEKSVLHRAGIGEKEVRMPGEWFEKWIGDFRALAVGLSVLVVAVGVWLAIPEPTEPLQDFPVLSASEFRPRGGETYADIALFVFCWDRESNEIHRVIDHAYAETEIDSECHLTNSLQFAYSNHSAQYNYVYLLGWNEDGERTWYYPRPSEPWSKKIQTEVVRQVWEQSIFLEVNHRRGSYTIAALFSQEPLSTKEVNESFGIVSRSPLDPMQWPPLEFEDKDVIEQRIRFDIRGETKQVEQ